MGVHDCHGIISSDAVSNSNSVLEQLAHLVVEVAVADERCPYKGLVGVLRRLLLAGLVERCQVARRSWRAHGEPRRAAEERLHRHECAVRVLQSYSAMSLGLLSPSVLYSFAHDVMRSSWYPANECQPLSRRTRRTDGRTAAPIKLALVQLAGKSSGPGSDLALAHVLPSHAYVGQKIHLE